MNRRLPAAWAGRAGAALLLQDARGQARAIAAREISAEALLEAQYDAIRALNPSINAYVQLAPPAAAAPAVPGSPLAGSTFAVKDNLDVAGYPSHAGLRALHAPAATGDAAAVARLKSAGMVFLGKLNMHAMALGASNHNVDFGHCYNPHRLTHTPGGSSGGSGAAVAAGLCGIALGTDTMGSVRVPAAYCGVVGFKASFDAIPVEGLTALSTLLDHVGILARSVEDVIAAFDVLLRDPSLAPAVAERAPGQPFHFAVPKDLASMGATPEVCAAFAGGVERLRQRGFVLEELDMAGHPFSAIRRAGLLLCEAELSHALAPVVAVRRARIPPELLAMLDHASRQTAPRLGEALRVVVQAGQWLSAVTASCDGLLLPTTPQPAFAMDAAVPHNQADFTAVANMNGAPAISLPLPVAEGALPIGLQLIGRRGQDRALLQAALRAQ